MDEMFKAVCVAAETDIPVAETGKGETTATEAQSNAALDGEHMYKEGQYSFEIPPEKVPEKFENTSIVEGPYYSIKRRAGILTCPGGLVTNDRLQVLDTENKVIDGLYVAGNTVVVSMVMTILSMASRQLSQVTQADVLWHHVRSV